MADKLHRLVLAERVQHERELREADKAALDHERELRLVADQHERELRLVAEEAVEKARQIQFDEYERRLQNLNHAHELEVQRNAVQVPRLEFEQFKRDLLARTELAAKEQGIKHESALKSIDAIERSFDAKLEAAIERLNTQGTVGYRETAAEQHGREQATKEILSASQTNRRWMIGLTVTIVIFGITTFIGVATTALHALNVI